MWVLKQTFLSNNTASEGSTHTRSGLTTTSVDPFDMSYGVDTPVVGLKTRHKIESLSLESRMQYAVCSLYSPVNVDTTYAFGRPGLILAISQKLDILPI